MPRPVTLALVWHQMNSDNLGVGALTLANLEILRAAAAEVGREVRFEILGWRDPRPWYENPEDVTNVPLRTRHLVLPNGPFSEAIARADAVFDIGGGDSFTDIYGPKRFLTVWGTKLRSIYRGKPLILCPQTIGPFESTWARILARYVMNRSRAIVSRDGPSTAFLSELGIRSNIIEATDVAMRLPYPPPLAPHEDGKIRVGLNVSGLLMSGGYTGANQFGLSVDYPALVHDIICWFMAQSRVELHLIGHVQSETQPLEDDQRASAALVEEFPGTFLAPVFVSPVDAKSYISGMDFFLGARMHATIAAFSTGVPVIPMAYSRKFQGVFATLGYDQVADLRADSAEAIMVRIQKGFENRKALKQNIESGMANVDARLAAYQSLATEIIRDL